MGNQERYTTTINSKPLYHVQGNIIMYMCVFISTISVSRPWGNARERAILLVSLENGRYLSFLFFSFFW